MKIRRSSLNTLRQLLRALSETDPRISPEPARVANDAAASGPPVGASSTAMALGPLGLIGADATTNLSV